MMLSRGVAVLAVAAFVSAPLHAQRRGGARRPARAAAPVVIPTPRSILGFSRVALREPAPPGAVVDIASQEGAAPGFLGGQPKAEPVAGV